MAALSTAGLSELHQAAAGYLGIIESVLSFGR